MTDFDTLVVPYHQIRTRYFVKSVNGKLTNFKKPPTKTSLQFLMKCHIANIE